MYLILVFFFFFFFFFFNFIFGELGIRMHRFFYLFSLEEYMLRCLRDWKMFFVVIHKTKQYNLFSFGCY